MSDDSGNEKDYDNERYSDEEKPESEKDQNEDDAFPDEPEEKSNRDFDEDKPERGDAEDEFGQYAEEDGVSFLDHQVNDAIQKRREEKERARAAGDLAFSDNVDEKLGEDFEDSQWVPPTIEVVCF
jgi:superfamily I DNA and/or RNA helicase